MEREVHGEFVIMEFVAIEVIAEVCEILVVEKTEFCCWRCLPGEKGGGERGR
jgi:hypothetical protein